MNVKRMHTRQWTVLALILAAALLIWSSVALNQFLNEELAEVRAFIEEHHVIGLAVFVIASIISALFSFFTAFVLIPIATLVWGELTTFFLLLGSWLLGTIGGYYLARYYGRKAVSYFVSLERLARYERQLEQNVDFASILLFRIAMPSEVPTYLLGIMRYPFGKYFLATLLAMLPFAWGNVYASELFLQGRAFLLSVVLFAGVVLVAVTWYLFRRGVADHKGDQDSS